MLIQRHILKVIEQTRNEYPVTFITGARQVGKTTLATMLQEKYGYEYLTFDDTDFIQEAKKNPKEFIRNHPAPIIFDEVQRVPELFPQIEAIVNEIRRTKGSQAANGMYILTGSQRYSLMKGITESLSGRVGLVDVPPLSQAEIRGWEEEPFQVNSEMMMKRAENRILSDDDFYQSIFLGFYPARWENGGTPIRNYYYNYVKTYLERDVSQLIRLRKKTKFEDLLSTLASLTGEEFVPDNVAKIIGVDRNTVLEWTSLLQTADLISLLPPYYEDSIHKRIVKRKKLYFNDTGLACYLLGIDSVKTLTLSPFKGRLVETYIHNEIAKSLLNNGCPVEGSLFYYRDSNQNEIDLVLFRNGVLNFMECKSGKNFSTDAIKGFYQLRSSKYDVTGKCILCTTAEPYRIESGVYAYPIRCL